LRVMVWSFLAVSLSGTSRAPVRVLVDETLEVVGGEDGLDGGVVARRR
jgi:hypothetical protein